MVKENTKSARQSIIAEYQCHFTLNPLTSSHCSSCIISATFQLRFTPPITPIITRLEVVASNYCIPTKLTFGRQLLVVCACRENTSLVLVGTELETLARQCVSMPRGLFILACPFEDSISIFEPLNLLKVIR